MELNHLCSHGTGGLQPPALPFGHHSMEESQRIELCHASRRVSVFKTVERHRSPLSEILGELYPGFCREQSFVLACNPALYQDGQSIPCPICTCSACGVVPNISSDSYPSAFAARSFHGMLTVGGRKFLNLERCLAAKRLRLRLLIHQNFVNFYRPASRAVNRLRASA